MEHFKYHFIYVQYIRFPFDVPNTLDNDQSASITNKLSGQHISDDHHYDNIGNTMKPSSSAIDQLVTQLVYPLPSTPSIVDIQPETELIEFMREQWELPLPELIISVTGGAELFKLTSPRVRRAFQEGLVSAAVTTGKRQKENCTKFSLEYVLLFFRCMGIYWRNIFRNNERGW
jgi:hypothetical protein